VHVKRIEANPLPALARRELLGEAARFGARRRVSAAAHDRHGFVESVAIPVHQPLERDRVRPEPLRGERGPPFAVRAVPPVEHEPGHDDAQIGLERASAGELVEDVVLAFDQTNVNRLRKVLGIFRSQPTRARDFPDNLSQNRKLLRRGNGSISHDDLRWMLAAHPLNGTGRGTEQPAAERRPPGDRVSFAFASAFMDPESSFELIRRVQGGDEAALSSLLTRYRTRLVRWASGRLPTYARDMTDTEDLVQEALIGTLKHIQTFDARSEWALQAYLRRAVINRVRDELRRVRSRPERQDVASEVIADEAPTPLEAAMGKETFARYESALGALSDVEREAVIARIELGCSYREIALLVDKTTPDAARMMVARALTKLAAAMAHA
jgi:RNA polymerase sigma factor (sigma-70 family)